MGRLQGLTPFNNAPQQTDQGVLEAHGGPVDQSHSQYGDQLGDSWPASYGTGYQGTGYGPDVNQGEAPVYDQPGMVMDKTPSAHSAPYARGLIQPDLETPGSYAYVATELAEQRSVLHGTDLGAPGMLNRFAPGGRETPIDVSVDRYDSPNVTNLAPVPGQLKQGNNGAGRDVSQGYGQLNDTEEFQHGHSIRIISHDGLAWDRSLTYAPPLPLWPKTPIQRVMFDGPDSPYGSVLGDTSTGQQIVWEGRIGNPTVYQQPPEPAVNQATPSSDVWAWNG